MGGKSSTKRRYASSCNYNSYPQSPYYTPQHHHAPPSYRNYGARTPKPHRRLDQKYSLIADDYTTLDQVTAALAQAGLESSNLIVGIDFTKSNEWTGSRSFHHRSLHHIGNSQNPYEQAISIIGKTLSAFDEDNLIPCFGFGDASTRDKDVFSFYPDAKVCCGFEQLLKRYRELVPNLQLSGPTSFAPIIEMAMKIVEESRGQYHVLLIIADGQVTRSTDTPINQCSIQEQKTIEAIVRASEYPLSIILVGVGDGPWDMMKEFDDNIPARVFDNFQFVNFTEIMLKNENSLKKETEFALAALMEIPSQYQATIELNLLGHQTGNAPHRDPFPPPSHVTSQSGSFNNHSSNIQQHSPLYHPRQPAPLLHDNKVCPICQDNPKDMAFNCGHQTCCDCGLRSQTCPTCSSQIITRIKLY